MPTLKQHLALALSAFLLLGLSAVADELIMKDGSRLLGTVVKNDGASAFDFKTTYAGVITIKWTEVETLHADKTITVLLKNGSSQQVSDAGQSASGMTTLTLAGTSKTFSVDEVAFFNPEPWRLGQAWSWTGNVNASLNFERGNSKKDEYSADFATVFRHIDDRIKLSGDYDRDTNKDNLTDDDWRFSSRYDHFVNDRLFYAASLGLEHDRFADLRLRTTVGPLLGYDVYESKITNLDLAAGPIWVSEDFYDADSRDYLAFGWSVDFDHSLTPNSIQLYHRQEGLIDVDQTNNLVWNAWTGLRFPIYAGIVASTEVKVEYDGAAGGDTDNTDTTYNLKLGYEW